MRGSTLAVVTVALLFALPSAHAGSRDAQERAAKKACLTGDASKGAEILAELYIDTNEPMYIFNQGRCYEQNQRYEDAVGRFREYLRKAKDISAADRADVDKHIADCETLLASKGAAATSTTAPAAPVAPVSPVAPVPVASPPPETVVTEPEPPMPATPPSERGSPGLRLAGLVTAGVGVAALGAAIGFNLKARSTMDSVNKNFDQDTYSSSKNYKTLAIVGYAVGAACLAGGAVLYLVGRPSGGQPSVALAPALTGDTAGALVTGSF